MVQALLILHLVLFVVTKISIKIAWWNDRVEKKYLQPYGWIHFSKAFPFGNPNRSGYVK
jgi:hypothetical protein